MAKKSQEEKFREAAREAEVDESEERFNETLKGQTKSSREASQKQLPSSAGDAETDASSHQKPKSS